MEDPFADLRRQHAEIERLYAQRSSAVEDYEKVPDWSLLEATQESLREHMAEIHRLSAENAALRAALKQAVARQGFTNDELISARALIANATGKNK